MSCVWRLDHVDLTDTDGGRIWSWPISPCWKSYALRRSAFLYPWRWEEASDPWRALVSWDGAGWGDLGMGGISWWRVVELISCFNLLCDVFGVQRMGNPHKSTNDWGIYAGEYSFFFGRAIWSKFKDPTWTATVKVTVRWMWRMLTFEQVGPLGWRNFEAWAVLR